MTWRRTLAAVLLAYLATIAVLIPLSFSMIYILSSIPLFAGSKWAIYIGLALCIMTGVGLLRWFRSRIEARLR